MSSVSIVYRKDKLNKKGEAPIHFRIIKDRKISYIASGIMLPAEHWDEEKHKIKSKHTNSQRLNSFLSNKFAELQDNVFEHETISKSLTSRMLKEKTFGKKPVDFFELANEVLQFYASENKIGTHDKCQSILKKLEVYTKGRNLSFQEITVDFLYKYESYLRTELGNKTNTIHKDLKFIRRVFNEAYKRDLIDHQVNPFLRYKLKQEKTSREYLTEEELKVIENLVIRPFMPAKLELHRDMFVFSTYTGGLRVSDILQLKWQNFDGSHIHFCMKKTKEQLSIKLPDRAIAILNKYKPEKVNKEAHIFPMLPNDLDDNNPRELDHAISSATAYINKNLKVLAEYCKINKPLSFHISRHTFATRALYKGMSIDKVSKLMGHSAIRVTQIYAKIVSSELDKAMDIFND